MNHSFHLSLDAISHLSFGTLIHINPLYYVFKSILYPDLRVSGGGLLRRHTVLMGLFAWRKDHLGRPGWRKKGTKI